MTATATTDSNTEQARARPRRRVVRVVVVLVLAVLALVVVDRLAALLAARAVAGSVQSAQDLARRPRLTIRGFPFLTQVVTGRYRQVDIAAAGPVTRQGVEVAQARASLRGVRVNVSDVFHGTVRQVPVASGTGSALLTYPELNAVLTRVTGPFGAAVTVTGIPNGKAQLKGPFGLSLRFVISITDGRVRVVPDAEDLLALPAPLRSTVATALTPAVQIPPLPFNVQLTSGRLTPDGLVLDATARDSLFPAR